MRTLAASRSWVRYPTSSTYIEVYYGAGATDLLTTKFWMGIGLALLAAVTGAAQLPPQVELDRLLLRAEQRIEAERYKEADAALEEAGRLAQAEGLELPDRIWFQRASLALALDRPPDAVKFVTRYLQGADRDADHYQEALELIERAEAEVARREVVERVRPSPESLCRKNQDHAECWIEIKRDCWLWNGDKANLSAVEGSGECVNALAHGEWEWTWEYDERWSYTGRGVFEGGKQTARWVVTDENGQIRNEGPYSDGKKEGVWTERFFSASREPGHIHDTVFVGPYVNGRRHGYWKSSHPPGVRSEEPVESGEYRNGVKHGPWKTEYRSGNTHISRWVNGKLHGLSESRYANGQLLSRTPYLEGKQHGLRESFDERGKRTSWRCYEDGEETANSWRTKRRKPPCEER